MIPNTISEIMVKTTVLMVIVLTDILIDINYQDSDSDYSHENCVVNFQK